MLKRRMWPRNSTTQDPGAAFLPGANGGDCAHKGTSRRALERIEANFHLRQYKSFAEALMYVYELSVCLCLVCVCA